MNEFTDELKNQLCYLINCADVFTDSDIEEFCDDHDLSYGEVFHWLSVVCSPEQCRRCKYVDMYPKMYPCNDCKRACSTDHYEERRG